MGPCQEFLRCRDGALHDSSCSPAEHRLAIRWSGRDTRTPVRLENPPFPTEGQQFIAVTLAILPNPCGRCQVPWQDCCKMDGRRCAQLHQSAIRLHRGRARLRKNRCCSTVGRQSSAILDNARNSSTSGSRGLHGYSLMRPTIQLTNRSPDSSFRYCF